GEIRLADFDLLELTNLNRIRTGLYNLGICKAVSVAREIAEIDPFLKVICFTDGITDENIDDFFLKGGKLDLVIDECDGLDVKITARYKARELRIPVLMEASDRGLLDVERFDLEPDRPILHGLIEHLDTSKIKTLKTNEEKIPFLLAINEFEKTSSRLRASMLEITQTITTWPQLASAVTLGGGITADVWRRVALNQYHESGRYYIDLEELVKDKSVPEKASLPETTPTSRELTKEDLIRIYHSSELNYTSPLPLEDNVLREIIQAATLAPSAGNNQPWKWLYTEGVLLLFHDKSRTESFMDFQHFTSYMSLGAAIENLEIKAGSLGLEVKTDLFPAKNNDELIAAIRFYQQDGKKIAPFTELNNYIPVRVTNRKNGPRQDVSPDILEKMKKAAASIEGAELEFITNATEMKELGEIIAEADRLRFLHPEGHDDLFNKELRWSQEEAETTRDGIDIATIDLTLSEKTGFRVAKSKDVIENLRRWNAGSGFGKMSRKAVASSSALGVISIPVYSPADYVNAGRALERVWLTATREKIAFHPLLAPLTFFLRLDLANGEKMFPEMKDGVSFLREKYIRIVKPKTGKRDVFLFRISIAETPEVLSLRKPIEEVLFIE
ncbi:MAG TPA: Rv1355c family protein, partial [Cytophagaceae bacterium]